MFRWTAHGTSFLESLWLIFWSLVAFSCYMLAVVFRLIFLIVLPLLLVGLMVFFSGMARILDILGRRIGGPPIPIARWGRWR